MRRLHRFFIVILMTFFAGMPAYALPNQEAFDLVQSTTDKVFSSITEKREIFRENEQLFYQEIDALLSPVVDFERISRRVMAKYYRQATPEQREDFIKVFKQSLLKLYAKGLLDVGNEKINILPPPKGSGDDSKKQIVDVDILSASGQKYSITYSMFLNQSEQWKMENVIVNGINIGLTYRNQFSRQMEVKNNDIAQVISGWTSSITSE